MPVPRDPRRQADIIDDHGGDWISAFVISDIHAHSLDVSPTSSSAPSWVRASAAPLDSAEDALVGLKHLIGTSPDIRADLLICCGDIVDKALPTALTYVWNQLQELARLLRARQLIVTAGNHDVDSRYTYNDYDAKGHLQSLGPAYPHADESVSDRYWSRHFYIVEGADHRLVVLNSAAFHGGPSSEWEHGRISPRTLSRLRERITTYKKLNLLVTHHHLVNNPHIDAEDYSIIHNAEDLVAFLSEDERGPWVVLHGHKHHPRLLFAPGATGAPLIFSAGSVGAKLYSSLAQRARNQAYYIEFCLRPEDYGLDLAGRFTAWDYVHEVGWQEATESSGLPHTGGFGCRESVARLAGNIQKMLSPAQPSLSWEEICARQDALQFLMPDDIARLRGQLDRIGLTVRPKSGRTTITRVTLPSDA